jgi:CheY-like chemotaxis protein
MIKADPAQIDQVIINLVTNAKDAMPFGGELIITTKNFTLTEDDKKQYPFIIPGEYVLLSVKDNGVGMTPDVKSRVFEPFFTTKEMGKGTGLGLAVVYGIVKQNSGFIFIDSEEGKGTEVKILLPPTMEKEQDEETTIILPDEPVVPTICILVVEDEDSVRKFIVKSLKHKGYNVLEAKDGVQAINLAEKYSDKIDLLLTDVIMPDMNGSVLANKLMSAGRVKHVLYMSGYTENIIARFGVLNEGIELIQKPFTAEELIKKINTILKTST